MKKYIVIPRFQFNSFYKSGYLFVKGTDIVHDNSSDSRLVEDLVGIFKKLPYFEYDDEYLILAVEMEAPENEDTTLSITQVKEIMALSHEALISIESKFDTRIHIITSKWATEVLARMERHYTRLSVENGISALWKISDFIESWKDEFFMSEALLYEIIEGVVERGQTKSLDKMQPGIISQAIVYDRIETFPEGRDGYLFDIFEILCNNLQLGFQFKHTELYSWLLEKHISGQSNCWTTYAQDNSFEKLINIKQTLRSKFPDVKLRWENAIAWFLSQKVVFQKREQFDIKQFRNELNLNLKDFLPERKLAVILLGAFLGYKNLYDSLYDVLDLGFFKKKETITEEKAPHPNRKAEEPEHTTETTEEPTTKAKTTKPKGTKRASKAKGKKESASHAMTLDFDITKEKTATTIIENIESSQNKEIELEIIRNSESEISTSPTALSENKKGEINGIILKELPSLKEFRKWILECYVEYYSAEEKTKEYFSSMLIRPSKPAGFGKKETDQVVRFFEKKKLIN